MLARHMWMQKLWDDEYADYEVYVDAVKKVVIRVINVLPAYTYKDYPVKEALEHHDNCSGEDFAKAVLQGLRQDTLLDEYNYLSTGLVTRTLEEAFRRTDHDNRLYIKHVQATQAARGDISTAVRAYIDEWAEEFTMHYYFIADNGTCYTPDKYMPGYPNQYPRAGKLWSVAATCTGKYVKRLNRRK